MANYIHSTSIYEELYDPWTPLYTISTRHFDIIFPEESRETAFYITTFADELYEKVEGILKSEHNEKITVILTPHVQLANGFASHVPYTHIVLMDYCDDALAFNFDEYFKNLFLHEMVHAISLNTKRGLYKPLSSVFGNYMSPNVSMPKNFLEGVTLSFEGQNGFGRVNDPDVHEQIKQDIQDNNFKTIDQASGPYDLYPGGMVYYNYGGLFSLYLQKKYGMEKYAELWQKNGGLLPFFMPIAFQDVYHTNIYDEWGMFKEEIRYRGNLGTNLCYLEPFSEMKIYRSYYTPWLCGKKIYFCDLFDDDIKAYDIEEKKLFHILDLEGAIAISDDESRMLITLTTMKNGVYKRVTKVYDLKNKMFLKNEYEKLGYASFFKSPGRNGIIGVRARTHMNDLVFFSEEGEMKTLIYGTESLNFISPIQYSENKIVFILSDKGKRQIAFYDFETGEISVIDAPVDYIRGLGVYEGKILFSYNNDYTFYKAGIIDGKKLLLQTNNIDGGVFNPLLFKNSIYYTGRFSKAEIFLKYPVDINHFDGLITNYTVSKFIYEPNTNKIVESNFISKPYNPLPYLLPRFWMPWITTGKDYIPDSIGIMTLIQDPVYQNRIFLYTAFNYFNNFENAYFYWHNTSMPVHFAILLEDQLYYYSSIDDYIRRTSASINPNYILHFIPVENLMEIGFYTSYSTWAFNNGNPSAYYWQYNLQFPILTAYLRFANSEETTYFYGFSGYNITLFYDYNLLNNMNKYEINFFYFPSFAPFSLKLYGAYSPWEMFNPASLNYFFGGNHYPSFYEYQYINTNLKYYLGGEIGVTIFKTEIQHGVFLLPLYFNRFYPMIGCRTAYLEDTLYTSVFCRLNLELSLAYGEMPVKGYIEGYYAPNNNSWGFYFGYEYSLVSL